MEHMSKKRRMLVTTMAVTALIAFLSTFVLSLVASVKADTRTDLQKKITEAQKSKSEAQKKLQSIQNDKKAVEGEKERLDKSISSVNNEILSVTRAIEQNEAEISLLEQDIVRAESEIDQYNDLFKTRARIMYERGSGTYLDVLFSSQSFSDLIYKAEMVKQIVDHDKAILRKMADAKQIIVNAKQSVENQKEQKELNLKILEEKKEELRISLTAREAALQKLLANEEAAKKMYDRADAEEAKLKKDLQAQLAKESQQTPAKYTGGKLQWPCPSTYTITSSYGMRNHPIQGRVKKHTGIDIGGSYGASVVAAEAGTVIRAGWNGGYGQYIVINHGGGLQTLYAHNSALLVKAGDTVTRGQKIALVGSTGNSTGPHLHFEVLVNGVDTDPMAYLK